MILRSICLALGVAAGVLAPALATSSPLETRVLDRAASQRLLANKGLTLQWIDWNRRGQATVRRQGRVLTLEGAQAEAGGPGRLSLSGTISEVGRDYFIFQGTIRITDTPQRGRICEATRSWRFAVTQRRKYYRLREFEWCDGLTDYIDLYF